MIITRLPEKRKRIVMVLSRTKAPETGEAFLYSQFPILVHDNRNVLSITLSLSCPKPVVVIDDNIFESRQLLSY